MKKLIILVIPTISFLVFSSCKKDEKPKSLPPSTLWLDAIAGCAFTLAIKSDHTLWSCGDYEAGSSWCGFSGIQKINMQMIGSSNDWARIEYNNNHTIGLKRDSTLWGWGENSYDEVGVTPFKLYVNEPVLIDSNKRWIDIAAGSFSSLGILSDGTLWAWGENSWGQLGTGNILSQKYKTQIGTASNWKKVSTGFFHTLGLKSDGTLWAWGDNNHGELGDGTTTDHYTPAQIGTSNNWAIISAGNEYSIALKTDGTLWAWGYNINGCLGIGNNINQYIPVQVGTDHWLTISAGSLFTLGIKKDGTLWSWGYNSVGQLGNGNTTNQFSPVQIGSDTNWKYASANNEHGLGIKTDGTLWAWGTNINGQLGINSHVVSRRSPVQVR